MAIHTATTERIVKFMAQARNKNMTLEDIIMKEYNVKEVIISEMGGVWLSNGEEGNMMTLPELEELITRLSNILG